MNSLKVTIDLTNFEFISEESDGKLLGGFSASFSATNLFSSGETSNNCSAGNCATGCGDGQNSGCNTVSGCGKKP